MGWEESLNPRCPSTAFGPRPLTQVIRKGIYSVPGNLGYAVQRFPIFLRSVKRQGVLPSPSPTPAVTSFSSAIPNSQLSLIPYGAVAGQLPDGLCLGPGSLGCVRPWPPRAQPCDPEQLSSPAPAASCWFGRNLFPWLTTATARPLSHGNRPRCPCFLLSPHGESGRGRIPCTSQPRRGRAAAAKPCFQRASKHVAPCALQPTCLPQLLTTLFPAPSQAQRLG